MGKPIVEYLHFIFGRFLKIDENISYVTAIWIGGICELIYKICRMCHNMCYKWRKKIEFFIRTGNLIQYVDLLEEIKAQNMRIKFLPSKHKNAHELAKNPFNANGNTFNLIFIVNWVRFGLVTFFSSCLLLLGAVAAYVWDCLTQF